mmetsp:Transcript_73123/g.205964  ORF Transcript_73123/g.205964 Transcript_73123/m.205964 type:complete len:293 (+) Transcript_73123:10-888(+)
MHNRASSMRTRPQMTSRPCVAPHQNLALRTSAISSETQTIFFICSATYPEGSAWPEGSMRDAIFCLSGGRARNIQAQPGDNRYSKIIASMVTFADLRAGLPPKSSAPSIMPPPSIPKSPGGGSRPPRPNSASRTRAIKTAEGFLVSETGPRAMTTCCRCGGNTRIRSAASGSTGHCDKNTSTPAELPAPGVAPGHMAMAVGAIDGWTPALASLSLLSSLLLSLLDEPEAEPSAAPGEAPEASAPPRLLAAAPSLPRRFFGGAIPPYGPNGGIPGGCIPACIACMYCGGIKPI